MAVDFDCIRGALYGVAIGDALGGPLEFMSRAAVRMAYPQGLREMVGGGWLDLESGETTDDTAMSLCVAYGIVAANGALDKLPDEIGRRFIDWLDSNPPDVGNTCRAAIQRARQALATMPAGQAWTKAAESLGPNQEGNGALMRCIYPGLWYADYRMSKQAARLQAGLTHSGENSKAFCEWYSDMVWLLVQHKSPILAGDPSLGGPAPSDWSPSGYVVDTLRAVILAMQNSSFEEVLVEAVNFGGDADTVGAIAGGLAGAKFGYQNIPARWLQALDPQLCADLDALAQAAFKNRT